uniref:HMG box domain-containing protein n=1 Tax=Timema poppense TaxID=170557 RepID=A0A7R9CW05_TIMPO|nr:unnamed protein product [Timema poppensis]
MLRLMCDLNNVEINQEMSALSKCSRSSFPECRQIAGFKQTLEEKLGIPVKPKKPLTPFFRFMGQIRPMVVQQHPGAKVTDYTKIIAQQWKKLEPPAKQKFEEEFKKEMIHYIAVRVSYENSLTDQQKKDLQKAKEQKVESKQQRQLKMQKLVIDYFMMDEEMKRQTVNIKVIPSVSLDSDHRLMVVDIKGWESRKKKKKELGKPKKPITAFLMFFQEKAKLRGDIPFKIWQQKMSQEWESLPDEIKVQYLDKASQYWQSYLQELQLWEEKMIRLGHIDVVRNEALIEPRSNK